MISTSFFIVDIFIWLLAVAGPVVGFLIWRSGRPAASVVAAPVRPVTVEPDPLPVPTQRVGIPPTALVRIQEACGGHIKDGELDIRFELRSRRDCDKMLGMMRNIRENLQHTKSVFDSAQAEIQSQLDGLKAAAGRSTSRVAAILGKTATNADEFVTVKLAELDGYVTATKLIDKFLMELSSAELSIQELPFYTTPEPPPARLLQTQS